MLDWEETLDPFQISLQAFPGFEVSSPEETVGEECNELFEAVDSEYHAVVEQEVP